MLFKAPTRRRSPHPKIGFPGRSPSSKPLAESSLAAGFDCWLMALRRLWRGLLIAASKLDPRSTQQIVVITDTLPSLDQEPVFHEGGKKPLKGYLRG